MSVINRINQKRIRNEIKMLKKDPIENIEVYVDEKNMLDWYFLMHGRDDSDYKGGEYIGKVMNSPEYPFKPPDFMMLTPNGRFTAGKKICLSNSKYHSDEWSSMWNMKAIILGFESIMVDDKDKGISHIKVSKDERATFANKSKSYNASHFPNIMKNFIKK